MISGNGNDRAPTSNRDVMKMLGIQNSTQSLDVFGKAWDPKYQIPKLSARSSTNDKDTTTTNTSTVAASPLNSTQETNSTKSMVNFMSHSFGGNQLSNKIHGGRASSVSPKYNLNTDNISNFNKDIHIYKSSSSDALQHQTQSSGHHMQLTRYVHPLIQLIYFFFNLNVTSISFDFFPCSGNNAFASLLSNKSPLHHSSVNVVAKSLLSNTSQMGGSGKNSISNTNTNVGLSSSSPIPKDLLSFHDQMKKNRQAAKQSDNFSANSLMNPNQMRSMQSSTIPLNQTAVPPPPMRRNMPPTGTSPQQVLLSSDDEIMDDSLVGK